MIIQENLILSNPGGQIILTYLHMNWLYSIPIKNIFFNEETLVSLKQRSVIDVSLTQQYCISSPITQYKKDERLFYHIKFCKIPGIPLLLFG